MARGVYNALRNLLDHRNCFLAPLPHDCVLSSPNYLNRLSIIITVTSHKSLFNHSQTQTWHFYIVFTKPCVSCVLFHMSGVTCHLSHVTWHIFLLLFYKLVELVGRGSVINGATPSRLFFIIIKNTLIPFYTYLGLYWSVFGH